MDDTYKANVYCKNCDFRGEMSIPKGQTIEYTKCDNCGNPELMKDQNVVLRANNNYDNGFDL